MGLRIWVSETVIMCVRPWAWPPEVSKVMEGREEQAEENDRKGEVERMGDKVMHD